MIRAPLAPIRRILLALEAGNGGSAAMEAATHLAAQLNAELHGLFLEDINLIRLAELPFAREIGLTSAGGGEEPVEQSAGVGVAACPAVHPPQVTEDFRHRREFGPHPFALFEHFRRLRIEYVLVLQQLDCHRLGENVDIERRARLARRHP